MKMEIQKFIGNCYLCSTFHSVAYLSNCNKLKINAVTHIEKILASPFSGGIK